MPQSMDVTQFTFAVEYFLAPSPCKAKRFGKRAKKLDDLSDVIVVFAIFRSGLGIEKIVASDQLKNLLILMSVLSTSQRAYTGRQRYEGYQGMPDKKRSIIPLQPCSRHLYWHPI